MSVDALSDAELRSKLIKYGYPVGPVTQTTRNILLKKLKNLMEIRSGTESRHSLAARYNIEDTDDDTSTMTSKKKKTIASNRRQTLANPIDNRTGTTRFDARTYRALGRILVKGQTENETERERGRENLPAAFKILAVVEAATNRNVACLSLRLVSPICRTYSNSL